MNKLSLKYSLLLHSILLLSITACNRKSEGSRKASLLITNTIQADAETDALKERSHKDDAADDPAIWIHPNSVEESRIIGTDKKGGLAVYNLDGKELFYYPDGKMNNVDIRQNISVGENKIDIAACTNRTTNCIDFYKIEPDGSLVAMNSSIAVKMKEEVYGFCLGRYKSTNYAFTNSVSGKIEQWEINFTTNGISSKFVRQLNLNGKTEGMVADDENGILFIGEEARGIWKINMNPTINKTPVLLPESTVAGNENICEDIEGISIYRESNGKGYLIASSQGNYSYALFDRKPPHKYIGSFRITDGLIDGAEETDGIDATNVNLGKRYPKGMLVVQDGYNKKGGKPVAQNFKIVSWEKVANLFNLDLDAKLRKPEKNKQ